MRVHDYLDLPEQAAPAAPGLGRALVYPKADGRLYSKDDAGDERLLGVDAPHLDDDHLRIRDEFDRADVVGALGSTTTHGRAWQSDAGWSITGQHAHKANSSYSVAWIYAHHAFGAWSVTLGPGCDQAEWWSVVRLAANDDYVRVGRGATNTYDVQKIVDGGLGGFSFMTTVNTPHTAPAPGDVVTVTNLPDDGIDVYVNGVLYFTGGDQLNFTSNRFGLAAATPTPTFASVSFLPIGGGDATQIDVAALTGAVMDRATLDQLTFESNLRVSGDAARLLIAQSGQVVRPTKVGIMFSSPTGAISNFTFVNGNARFAPVYVAQSTPIDRLACHVQIAGSTGAITRLALCADNGSFAPGVVLVQGTVDGTSVGTKSLVVSLTLDPGLYWTTAINQDNPTTRPSLIYINGHGMTLAHESFAGVATLAWEVNNVTGVLQDNPTVAANFSPPRVLMRQAP